MYQGASEDLKKYTEIISDNNDAIYFLHLAEYQKVKRDKRPKRRNYEQIHIASETNTAPW